MSAKHGWGFPGTLYVGSGQGMKAQAEPMDHPSMVSVTADLDLSSVASATVVKASLQVSFTVGIGTIVRTYDLAGGLSVSGVATQVLAQIIDESPVSTGEKYGVVLTMSRSPRPTGVIPVRTGFSGSVTGGGSQSVPIPPGASGVYVFGSSFAGLTLQMVAGMAFAGPAVVAETDVTIGQLLPLLAGARSINVKNGGSSPTTIAVAFAIDG